MFGIIVGCIPGFQPGFQFSYGHISKIQIIVEVFLIGAMRSFNFSILGRFAWIDQVMNDAWFLAFNIQSMQPWIKWVWAFIVSNIAVGKTRAIIGFYRPDSENKSDAGLSVVLMSGLLVVGLFLVMYPFLKMYWVQKVYNLLGEIFLALPFSKRRIQLCV